MRYLLSLTTLLLILASGSLSAQVKYQSRTPMKQASVKKATAMPLSRTLSSSSNDPGINSPCLGVEAMLYFEIDEVFSISGRGTIAAGVLHEGLLMLLDGPVKLYAVNEQKLRAAVMGIADPLTRAQALSDLQRETDSYPVTVRGIELKRQNYNVLAANPNAYGLFLDGVTKKELKEYHVLIDPTQYVNRFTRCQKISAIRPVRLNGSR